MDNREIIREFIQTEIMRQSNDTVLSHSDSLTETGIIDSLSIQVLISFLEKKFAIRVTHREIIPDNFETIEAIGNMVKTISNPSIQNGLLGPGKAARKRQ